jgi:hypothetical protein
MQREEHEGSRCRGRPERRAVRRVHVHLNLDGVAGGDVILSQSRCRAAGPDVLGGPPGAAGPSGPGGSGGPSAPGAPATPVTAVPNLTG